MNDRIRQLAEQATTRKFNGTGTDMGKLVLDQEKFAELIVRECTKVLEIQGANTRHEQYYYGASLIEEHFGVEE